MIPSTAFRAVVSSTIFVLVFGALSVLGASAQRPSRRPAPSATANRCGEAVPWKTDWNEAVAAAKREKKPIFWYVATTPGSPMDRKDVVDMYMRAGPFSAPEFVALLSKATIPLKLEAPARRARRRDAPEQPVSNAFAAYDVAAVKFIEPGFLLIAPDEKEIFRIDRLSTFHEGWLVSLLRRELAKANFAAPPASELLPADPAFATAEAALAAENYEEAAKLFASIVAGPRREQARLLQGCALWRAARREESIAVWKKLAAESPNAPFGWKAAAEAEGFGPFVRGFEEFGALADDALVEKPEGTRRERTEADADRLARRSVAYLLANQAPHGGFEDSNYDFGGRESLPDVYVAVTAIAGRALLQWRDVDRPRVDKAVAAALDYVLDEKRCSAKNTQERMWAHAYRILFLRDALDAGFGDAKLHKKRMQEIVRLVEGLQEKKGAWFHEYPNPFVTALAVHALHDARMLGAKVDPARFDAGVEALLSCRGDDGTFSYGFPGRGADETFSAGRGPHAEFALKLGGKSDDARVEAATIRSFEKHAPYEAARKYDDHAPPHGIGGFFFFYDEMHRTDAIRSLADATKRRELLARQREILLRLPEIDDRFVDSHELGKPYGTACGLICLKATAPDAQ